MTFFMLLLMVTLRFLIGWIWHILRPYRYDNGIFIGRYKKIQACNVTNICLHTKYSHTTKIYMLTDDATNKKIICYFKKYCQHFKCYFCKSLTIIFSKIKRLLHDYLYFGLSKNILFKSFHFWIIKLFILKLLQLNKTFGLKYRNKIITDKL